MNDSSSPFDIGETTRGGVNPFDIGSTFIGFAKGDVVFQRYVLEKILGRGGMGVVWLAHDQKLKEDVALKFLPENVRVDEAALQELIRETKRSRELTHTNIIRIHDLEHDDSSAAIVMEYVNGENLQKRSSNNEDGVLAEEELLSILPKLCEALDYAHKEAKIVHRDLKPANIMLSLEGKVTIADFGVARSLVDSGAQVTMVGASAGTMVYMSPQQLMGDRPDVSDDIYALGATVYELLVGAPPFRTGDVAQQIRFKAIPNLNKEREFAGLEKISDLWQVFIEKCLAKEREDRPSTCMEALEIMAPSSSKQNRLLKPALVACTALLLLGGAGLIFSNAFTSQNKPEILNPWLSLVKKAQESENDGRLLDALNFWTEAKGVGAGADAVEALIRLKALNIPVVIEPPISGSEVYVNGELVGVTPYMGEMKLGEYALALSKKGYKSKRGEEFFEIQSELGWRSERQYLERSTGTLAVDVNLPDAHVELSMLSSQADAPEELKMSYHVGALPTGVYKVTVSHVGLSTKTENVILSMGDSSKIAVDLDYGRINIESLLEGVEIYKGDQLIGTAPLAEYLLSSGEHDLVLKKSGYRDTVLSTIIPSDGSSVTESAELQKESDWKGRVAGEKRMFEVVPGLKIPFRWCAKTDGTLIGSPAWEGGRDDDETQHSVVFSKGFWIAETECTQEQWEKVMMDSIADYLAEGVKAPGIGPAYPMCCVSWEDTQKWLNTVNAAGLLEADWKIRLPTEAQWEYACRAGARSEFFFGGKCDSSLANFDGAYPYGGAEIEKTIGAMTPVAGYKANDWGLYDMHGNVWEWTSDFYGAEYYSEKAAKRDPKGPLSGANRVLRGGSWLDASLALRCANRAGNVPSNRNPLTGFRMILERK